MLLRCLISCLFDQHQSSKRSHAHLFSYITSLSSVRTSFPFVRLPCRVGNWYQCKSFRIIGKFTHNDQIKIVSPLWFMCNSKKTESVYFKRSYLFTIFTYNFNLNYHLTIHNKILTLSKNFYFYSIESGNSNGN